MSFEPLPATSKDWTRPALKYITIVA